MTVHALLEELEAAGTRIRVAEGGDKLALSGKRPHPHLLARVEAAKADLLEALKAAAKTDQVLPSPSPERVHLAAQPGHCGSCALWEVPELGLLGTCLAGRQAHGLPDGDLLLPVNSAAHMRCAVAAGAGWRARGPA